MCSIPFLKLLNSLRLIRSGAVYCWHRSAAIGAVLKIIIYKLVTVSEMAQAKGVTLQMASYSDFWQSSFDKGIIAGASSEGGDTSGESTDGNTGESIDGNTDESGE